MVLFNTRKITRDTGCQNLRSAVIKPNTLITAGLSVGWVGVEPLLQMCFIDFVMTRVGEKTYKFCESCIFSFTSDWLIHSLNLPDISQNFNYNRCTCDVASIVVKWCPHFKTGVIRGAIGLIVLQTLSLLQVFPRHISLGPNAGHCKIFRHRPNFL